MERIFPGTTHRPNAATAAPDGRARLLARRKVWLRVHLWLGLALGAALAVIGLTGSILVFNQEIDELLNPGLLTVEARPGGRAAFRPLGEVLAAAQRALPPGAAMSFGFYPRHDAAAWELFFGAPAMATPDGLDQYQVFVDPYSAQVTGQRLVLPADGWVPRAFIPFVFELHYALLLGGPGNVLVGVAAALLLISTLTGLILWWPLTGQWRKALTIKWRAGAERFNFDLHKLAGVYTLPAMLALLVSGIVFNLPEQSYALIDLFSPATNRYQLRSGPAQGRSPIPLEEAVATADQRYPEGRFDWLYAPAGADGTYTACKNGLDSLSRFVGRACVVVDQYSGAMLHIQAPDIGTAGDAFVLWQWPLHSGQAFGLPGRLLVCATGLACPLLFATGLIRWQQKRRAAHGKARRVAPRRPDDGR